MRCVAVFAILFCITAICCAQDECRCSPSQCGCCADMDIPELSINEEGCLNISYIPSTISLSLTFELNGVVYLNETVSAMDPDICFGLPIPVIGKLVTVCVDFYNMVYTSQAISGCVKLGFNIVINIITIDLGCFVLPIPADSPIMKSIPINSGKIKLIE